MSANVKTAPANGLDIDAINPRKGSRYSPNLFRWLTTRSRQHRAWTSAVYRDPQGCLWIGQLDDGYLIGARLIAVLCNGTQAESFAWGGIGPLTLLPDFWPRYMRDGRCAIDTEHQMSFVGDDTRWRVQGNERSCLWCGRAKQALRRWTETVQREAWEQAA